MVGGLVRGDLDVVCPSYHAADKELVLRFTADKTYLHGDVQKLDNVSGGSTAYLNAKFAVTHFRVGDARWRQLRTRAKQIYLAIKCSNKTY